MAWLLGNWKLLATGAVVLAVLTTGYAFYRTVIGWRDDSIKYPVALEIIKRERKEHRLELAALATKAKKDMERTLAYEKDRSDNADRIADAKRVQRPSACVPVVVRATCGALGEAGSHVPGKDAAGAGRGVRGLDKDWLLEFAGDCDAVAIQLNHLIEAVE